MTIELTSSQRRALRAHAHGLRPAASISQNGLSEAVLAEIDRGLRAHELIKVRVYGVGRDGREALLAEICSRLEAVPVQHIGNVLVLHRANPESQAERARRATKTVPCRKPQAAARDCALRRRPKT